MQNITEQFRDAIISKGITPPKTIIADGELHRFSTNGKPSDTSGWYIFHLDGIPAGSFGDWRKGISSTWCAKSKDQMSFNEQVEFRRRIKDADRQREKAKSHRQQQAAERAQGLWDASKPAGYHHPYLLKKRILPFLARQRDEVLVLPIIDFDEKLWSLQFIDPEGKKMLLSGGAKKGRFIPINDLINDTRLLICEGYATGVTLAQLYPDICVIAAIDAGNLEPVAVEARRRWSDREIIICADDDRLTVGNPGLKKGHAAAIASKALFTSPQWPTGAPESLSDFNDLACWLAFARERAK